VPQAWQSAARCIAEDPVTPPNAAVQVSELEGVMNSQALKRDSGPLMFDRQAETMPREELKGLQLRRLKTVLAYAYAHVPRAKMAFDAAGVKPEDCKTLADIARFPFTLKTDLRDQYPFGLFAVPRTKLARLHASSGTTGKPTVVGYTHGDLKNWADLMARSLACGGAVPGDVVHNAYGYGLFTGGLGAHYGAERLGCTVVPVSGGGTERQVSLLQDFAASVLCATPSYALNIAEVAENMGHDLRQSTLRLGMFGAEPWSGAMREDLQRRLGILAIDIYGLSEIMGPGVACECHVAQDGLHGWEDHFLFEVIDPKTLQPLPMGETGELVITTLTKEALPMIRYRTRDITRLSDEPCACGRTHVRIMRVTGRDDDMLIIRGVNVYPSQIEAVLVGLSGLSPHYQIVLTREGVLDAMTVEVEETPEARASGMDRRRKAEEVRHHIKSMIGVTCAVEVKAPGDVPRSQGKAVRVKDLRNTPR
jgi:phenylacetate-CoA ligase